MSTYTYEPLDLEGSTFRLARLIGGDTEEIQCELFQARFDDPDGVIDYEALSYAWGDTTRSFTIKVNGQILAVTENLFQALHSLRLQRQDRILWIDAICIDQSNVNERGHQVQLMSFIYNKAEEVIIWLGVSNKHSELVIHCMQELEQQTLNHACNSWTISDPRWEFLWSNVGLKTEYRQLSLLSKGIQDLLGRPWFKRRWILQEVANARSAKVVCGSDSVSARMLAVLPRLLGVRVSRHCQSVLDIMPGPPRKSSWWAGQRDLRTLLLKFNESQASDSRDHIYAVLGMCSDANINETLRVDYGKSEEELVQDVVAFLLGWGNISVCFSNITQWNMPRLLERVTRLEQDFFCEAIRCGDHALVKRTLQTSSIDFDYRDLDVSQPDLTPLAVAVCSGDESMVKLLLDSGKVDIHFRGLRLPRTADLSRERKLLEAQRTNSSSWILCSRSVERHGLTLLSVAILLGNDALTRQLLDYGAIASVDLVDIEQTPLLLAAKLGHWKIVGSLVQIHEVDVNLSNTKGRTAIFLAAASNHAEVVRLLVNADKVDVNLQDNKWTTPLMEAVIQGHADVVRILSDSPEVDINARDGISYTALSHATNMGNAEIVKILLDSDRANVNARNSAGYTPLMIAIFKRSKLLAVTLLRTGKVNVYVRNNRGETALDIAKARSFDAGIKVVQTYIDNHLL